MVIFHSYVKLPEGISWDEPYIWCTGLWALDPWPLTKIQLVSFGPASVLC